MRLLLWAEEIDGAGFAVVAGEEADAALLLGCEGTVGFEDEVDLLLPAEAVGVELREGAGGHSFGVAAFAIEVHGFGVAEPGVRTEDGDGHGEDEEAGEEEGGLEEGEGEGAVLLDGSAATEAMLPGDAAGGEEDGVDGGAVVVLGVESHHAGEKEDEGEAEPAPAFGERAEEEGVEAGEPDEDVEGMEGVDLGEEEGGRGEGDVFAFGAAVAEELDGGPVVAGSARGGWGWR